MPRFPSLSPQAATFQVLFGLTIFFATRQYYRAPATAPAPAAAVTATSPEWTALANQATAPQAPATGAPEPIPSDPEVVVEQANRAFAEQNFERAALLYGHLIEVGVTNAVTYNNLGITLHYLGRSDEALRVLDAGIAADPSYSRAWLTIGFVNTQLGNTDQARTALLKAQEMGGETDIGKSATEMLAKLGAK